MLARSAWRAHGEVVVLVLMWISIILLALAVASWGKYAVERNSVDEVPPPRLSRPLVLTGGFVLFLVATLVAQAALD
jgi:hypothetical protein